MHKVEHHRGVSGACSGSFGQCLLDPRDVAVRQTNVSSPDVFFKPRHTARAGNRNNVRLGEQPGKRQLGRCTAFLAGSMV